MEMKGKGKGKVQIVARTRANRDEDPSLASTILFKTFSGRISADMAHISISPTYIYYRESHKDERQDREYRPTIDTRGVAREGKVKNSPYKG